jgi:large subunit ribosomal protein L6
MSRVGQQPVTVPAAVTVTISAGNEVQASGPKGTIVRKFRPEMDISQSNGQVLVKRPSDDREHRALHGTTRSLIANMVKGVSEGFKKELEVHGVGYRVQKQGEKVVLQIGYSHPIEVLPPAGVEVDQIETFTPTQANQWLTTRFVVSGANNEDVGQFASVIRKARKVDPYRGKGIRYRGEMIRRKAGKTVGVQ